MIGQLYGDKNGLLTSMKHYKLVKKTGCKGDSISKHNHPEAHVIFTVIKGQVNVFLNDTEEHLVTSGHVLTFDGINSIFATFLEDSEVIVTLVNK